MIYELAIWFLTGLLIGVTISLIVALVRLIVNGEREDG
jgi:hypothetical protein